jgi:hypothetical protein
MRGAVHLDGVMPALSKPTRCMPGLMVVSAFGMRAERRCRLPGRNGCGLLERRRRERALGDRDERDLGGGSTLFGGKYYGVDIDREMLQSCRQHFDADRLAFFEATGRSVSYNRLHGALEPYRIPLREESVDSSSRILCSVTFSSRISVVAND